LAVLWGFAAARAILTIPRLRVEGKGDVPQPLAPQAVGSLGEPVQAAGLADLNDLADPRRLYSPRLGLRFDK
jgi:hypothetical protein